MKIQKYEPLLVVELKSGRKLITPARNEAAILHDLETKRFVKIEGVTINVLEVKTVEPLNQEYDVLQGLDEDKRSKALTRFKEFEKNLGRKPTREEKQKWIDTNLIHNS